MGCFSVQLSNDYSYQPYSCVDDDISQPKTDLSNALMIEDACHFTYGNYNCAVNIIINQSDRANMAALKYTEILQEKIDEKYDCLSSVFKQGLVMSKEDYQIKSNEILNEIIAKEFTSVNRSDINNGEWTKINPLTRAVLSWAKDRHDNVDINAIVSAKVIQYYHYKIPEKMKEILSTDCFITDCINEIVESVFWTESEKVTFADELAVSIKKKVEQDTKVAVLSTYAERQQFDDFIRSLSFQ